METTNPLSEIETADAGWRSLYKVGGAAALLMALFIPDHRRGHAAKYGLQQNNCGGWNRDGDHVVIASNSRNPETYLFTGFTDTFGNMGDPGWHTTAEIGEILNSKEFTRCYLGFLNRKSKI
jgi:hypothetical protein